MTQSRLVDGAGEDLFTAGNPGVVQQPGMGTPAHSTVAVGVASTAVVGANVARRYLMLANDSDTVLYVQLGGVATVNGGIRVNVGAALEWHGSSNYTGAVTAIHGSTGTKALLVTEGV